MTRKWENAEMKVIYNKLVRDMIPEIIEKNGDRHGTRILDDEEYKFELLNKIVEEAQEVAATAGNTEELSKEIADVLEVIDYLISAFHLNRDEIEKVRRFRKKTRGGYDKKIFLEFTRD